MTVQQLSVLVQISPKTIHQWTHTGFIPHYKLPKGVRFREADIAVWLKKREKKAELHSRFRCNSLTI